MPQTKKKRKAKSPRYGLMDNELIKDSKEFKLWEQNQTTSPLLRLPAEIRVMIYKEVIGTHLIRIKYHEFGYVPNDQEECPLSDAELNLLRPKDSTTPKYLPAHFCSTVFPAPPSAPSELEKWATTKDLFVYSDEYRPYQSKTFLNGVCRQLYKETAVLFYELNYFSFDSNVTMGRFFLTHDGLPLLQRHAMNKLVLESWPNADVAKALGDLQLVIVRDNSGRVKICAWDENRQMKEKELHAYWGSESSGYRGLMCMGQWAVVR